MTLPSGVAWPPSGASREETPTVGDLIAILRGYNSHCKLIVEFVGDNDLERVAADMRVVGVGRKAEPGGEVVTLYVDEAWQVGRVRVSGGG